LEFKPIIIEGLPSDQREPIKLARPKEVCVAAPDVSPVVLRKSLPPGIDAGAQ